ncbi:MAG: divergent polysaccharide deacetylase family protein [Desulfobacterales bacterium]
MAARKRPRPKKPIKKAGKRGVQKAFLLKAVAGLGVLMFLVVVAGVLMRNLISYSSPTAPAVKHKVTRAPKFEIYPKNDIPPRKAIPKTAPKATIILPKIAIIIDDIGYDKHIAKKFLDLDAVLTFSILPHSTHNKSIARSANSRGFDVMLHLPMEPDEYPLVDPGPGVLLTSMSPDQLISQLNDDLDSVPFVKGVNNHMGSKMTTVSPQLHQIFSVLKNKRLFFIDSRTTADTLCKPSADLFQIPFAQKDVFLDHLSDPDFIRKQIHRLIQIAGSHGEAVGIAHPHDVTYEILREMLPELKKKAVLVGASKIVHVGG